MLITKTSPLTGKETTLNLNITHFEMLRFEKGEELIQNIFPNLEPFEREFLISGYTQEDWDKMFKCEEEEE
jgi:hypothetical protein